MPTVDRRPGRRPARAPQRESGTQIGPGQIILVVLFVLTIVVLLFGRKFGLPSDLLSLLSGARPATVKGSEWKTVAPAGGLFTVQMPGEPAMAESTTDVDGARITMRTYSAEAGAEQVFLVQYADVLPLLKKDGLEPFLDACRNSAVGAMQGKLVSEKPIAQDNVPGRELLIEGTGRAMRARMFVKDAVFHSQQVVAPRNRVASAAAERFFASLAFRGRIDPAAPGWKEFFDVGGRFAVLLPGEPAATEEIVQTRAGNVTLHQFSMQRGKENGQYFVQYLDFSDELLQGKTAEQVLKNAGSADAFNRDGKIMGEQALALGPYAGREVQVETGQSSIKIRLYLVDRRLYKMLVVLPKGRTFSPDDERFLASFRLTS